MRLFFAVTASLLLIACSGTVASTPSQSPPEGGIASPTPTPHSTIVPAIVYVAPTPSPTVSPTPIPISHGPPYLVAIEAGHGGSYYWGASARDSDYNLWIEKDLNLDVAQRVSALLNEAGVNTLMIRTDDSTLTPFDPADYRRSLIAESQARVDVANAAQADLYLAIHFNGWVDDRLRGTETYCNPDRSFSEQSCALASFVQTSLVDAIRSAGYDDADKGVRNDSDVGGDPNNAHSFALGTNDFFNPTLMPGIISEALYLSNPDDLAFVRRSDGLDIIAKAIADGVQAYFVWLAGAAQ